MLIRAHEGYGIVFDFARQQRRLEVHVALVEPVRAEKVNVSREARRLSPDRREGTATQEWDYELCIRYAD